MGIEQTAGIFITGPKGRSINVNASGQIVATEGGSLEVYGFGPKGRAIGVNANGSLGVIVSSPQSQVSSPTASGSLDLNGQRQFDITLDKDVIFTSFDNPDDGARYTFILQQDSTGGRAVTWPSNVKWRGGAGAPTLTATSGSIDLIAMVYRHADATFLADFGLDFI